MSDARVRAERFASRYDGPAAALNVFVDELRADRGLGDIPYIDPSCGGNEAHLLTLLMDPGPMAHGQSKASGLLSWDNDDPTAAEVSRQLAKAGIDWAASVPWNASPWPGSGDRDAADQALARFVGLLPNLVVCMALGRDAQAAWDRLLASAPVFHRVRLIEGPHPSTRGLTRGGRQKAEVGRAALERAFAEAATAIAIANRNEDSGSSSEVRISEYRPPISQTVVASSASWDSLMLHQVCARCGGRIESPKRVAFVHKDCLLAGMSESKLRDGKGRRAVRHRPEQGTVSCEVCNSAERQGEILDVLIHAGCLRECLRCAGLATRRSTTRGPRTSRQPIDICLSCNRPIKPGGKCGCT